MGNTEVELVSTGETVDYRAMWEQARAERDAATAEVERLRAMLAQAVFDDYWCQSPDGARTVAEIDAALAQPGGAEGETR